VVTIDPGKVAHRVWLSTGQHGAVVEPRTLPVLRGGVEKLHRLVRAQRTPAVVFAVEATGGARTQLVSRRFKTDDRDCAALTYLAGKGHGRRVGRQPVEALRAAVAASPRPGRRPGSRSSACTISSTRCARGVLAFTDLDLVRGTAVARLRRIGSSDLEAPRRATGPAFRCENPARSCSVR
jgi:hypothetical protein